MHFCSVMTEKERPMTSSTHDDRWRELCQAIVEEPDSNRLMELVNKLNRVLEERETDFKLRLGAARQSKGGAG
jgi:hypothetical protein